MAGRVTLLILMTGLFAAAWSSDRAPETGAKTVSRTQRRAKLAPQVKQTKVHRWSKPGTAALVAQNRDWQPTEMENQAELTMKSSVAPSSVGVPLGTYLVVMPDGRTQRIQIRSLEGDQSLALNSADHFAMEVHGQRQHWIRLDDAALVSQNQSVNSLKMVLQSWQSHLGVMSNKSPSSKVTIHKRSSLQELMTTMMSQLKLPAKSASSPIASETPASMNR